MKIKTILSVLSLFMMASVFSQTNAKIDSLLSILKTTSEDTVKVNNLNTLSRQYIQIKDFEVAMEYADSALLLADKLNYNKGRVDVFDSKGLVSMKMGNYLGAAEKYKFAVKINEEIGNKKAIANSYCNLGLAYYRQGSYTESMVNYLAAFKVYEEIGDKRGIAESYTWIGNINTEQTNYPDAMKYYLVALKLWEEIGDELEVAWIRDDIGWVYYLQGNYPEAMKNYLLAKEIDERIGDNFSLSHIYCRIGQIYSDQENYSEALKYLNNALILNEDASYLKGAWIKIRLGKLYLNMNNYSLARKYLEDAISLSKKYVDINNLHWAYQALSKLDSAEGQFAKAFEDYKLFTFYKDSLANETSKNKIASIRIQYETEKKDKEIELLNLDKELKEKELARQKVFRNTVIGGAFLLLIVGVLIFRSFRLRKKLEKQQAISQERKRISADLHDDVGSGLSRIMLLTEQVKREAKTPETRKEAEKIVSISNELSSNIDEIVWALNSNNDYVENLVAYIRRYAAEYFENSSIKLKINTSLEMDRTHISGEQRQNIFYTVKEALHNIIKHAEATEAELRFTLEQDKLSVVIRDNGKGISKGKPDRFGNGLNNMRNRMKSINGNFSVESNEGTKITLSLQL